MSSSSKQSGVAPTAKASGNRSLLSQLKRERQQMQSMSSARHSNFAGTLVQQKSDGQQKFLAASSQNNASSRSGLKQAQPNTSAKRKTKKHQYFVGPNIINAIHADSGHGPISAGPSSRRANQALHAFCVRFMSQCYGPVMKSLKNEFRRDSSRLESHDKVIFFRLIWFFSQWRRVAMKEDGMTKLRISSDAKDGIDASTKSIGHLIFTMDVFTFNLVLTSADFFLAHKKYKDLSHAVALYAEMMHLLTDMYSSSDSTEQLMAMGLMDRLFYQSEPIDRVPKLLSSWIPGTFTRDFVCDLLELTHVTLKLLAASAKASETHKGSKRKHKSKKESVEPKDAVERMRSQAADFDVNVYMARKIVSNQTVFLFTQLLSQYAVNATNINDHIVAFFVRLCKFVVASDHDDEWDTEIKEDITLEPMLYNLPLLDVLNKILNDTTLQESKAVNGVLKFAATVVRHFARATEKNPMLYVEALFSHAIPRRFCESVSNMYVTEELLMIAERDFLLEQSREDDDSVQEANIPMKAAGQKSTTTDIEVDEEELEFIDVKAKQINNAEETSDDGSNHDAKADSNLKMSSAKNEQVDLSETEKELDDEEERWNDRRSFVPKRKLAYPDEVNMDTQDKSDEDDANVKIAQATQKPEAKRIRRPTVFDDSDDEEFRRIPTTVAPASASARMLLEDSDED
jgi:timeless